MCLAIPGKIESIEQEDRPVMGTVSFGGVKKRVCLEWLPDAVVGDYVLVHVGFAIGKMDAAEAEATLKLLDELGEAEEGVGHKETAGLERSMRDDSPPAE